MPDCSGIYNPRAYYVTHVYKLDCIQFPSLKDEQWFLVERVEKDIIIY